MPKVIALASDKGGVGKSTLAVHLAGALTEAGARVVLIDEDERVASSANWAGRGPPFGFEVVTPATARPKKLLAADVLVIDTEAAPKRKDLLKLAARAERLLLPCGPSALELEATVALYERLEDAGADLRRVCAVLTRVPGGGARDLLVAAGLPVASAVLRASAAYVRAAERGVLVCDLKGPAAARAWDDVRRLAREVG